MLPPARSIRRRGPKGSVAASPVLPFLTVTISRLPPPRSATRPLVAREAHEFAADVGDCEGSVALGHRQTVETLGAPPPAATRQGDALPSIHFQRLSATGKRRIGHEIMVRRKGVRPIEGRI